MCVEDVWGSLGLGECIAMEIIKLKWLCGYVQICFLGAAINLMFEGEPSPLPNKTFMPKKCFHKVKVQVNMSSLLTVLSMYCV